MSSLQPPRLAPADAWLPLTGCRELGTIYSSDVHGGSHNLRHHRQVQPGTKPVPAD